MQGPYTVNELAASGDFVNSLLVCQDGDHEWHPVCELSAFSAYCSTPIISTGDYKTKSAIEKTPP